MGIVKVKAKENQMCTFSHFIPIQLAKMSPPFNQPASSTVSRSIQEKERLPRRCTSLASPFSPFYWPSSTFASASLRASIYSLSSSLMILARRLSSAWIWAAINDQTSLSG